MTHQQYIQTVKACATFIAMNQNSSSDFLKENIVGYKLLERRCELVVNFDKIKRYNSCTKDIKMAIDKANNEIKT